MSLCVSIVSTRAWIARARAIRASSSPVDSDVDDVVAAPRAQPTAAAKRKTNERKRMGSIRYESRQMDPIACEWSRHARVRLLSNRSGACVCAGHVDHRNPQVDILAMGMGLDLRRCRHAWPFC